MNFLQENIGPDAFTDLCDKIKAFMEVKWRSDQTVWDYVFKFDNAYTVAKSKSKLPEIPGAYLMYVLIKNAKISDHDRKIVLSAVDLKKPAEIYRDTKTSIRIQTRDPEGQHGSGWEEAQSKKVWQSHDL